MDIIKRNLIRAAVKTFGTETITNGLNSIKDLAADYKKKIILEPGETDVIGIVYLKNNMLMFASVTITEDPETGEVTHRRYDNVTPVNDIILKIIDNI